MKSLLVLAAIILVFGTLYLQQQDKVDTLSMFNNWKLKYNKKYISTEDEYRFQVYADNLNKINNHNQDLKQTYKLGENNFMDLTHEEFVSKYLNSFAIPQGTIEESPLTEEQLASIPNGVDWRGYTKMKEQGECASGWAFSATSSIEAIYYIRGGGQMIDLSEQHLVDCETVYSSGCSGGHNNFALSYAQAYGIRTTTEYPYVGKQGQCRFHNGSYKINSFKQIHGETNLRYALAQVPISVGVDASNWQFYTSGVFGNCSNIVNHFVLNVGYENMTNNWLIKNSWGSNWGEAGHIRLFPGDTCGVTLQAYENL